MPLAIITGASRGLGLALARELATRVRARDRARGAAELERAAREPAGLPRSPRFPATSLTPATATTRSPPPATDRPARQQRERARSEPQPSLADYPLAELERVYAINVLAPLRLAQLALPRMTDGGAILNVTSDAAVEPYEGWGGYGSSKAALEQLTAILAAEQPALRVYAVDPGDMRTRMHQEAFPARTSRTDRRPVERPWSPCPDRGRRPVRPLPRKRCRRSRLICPLRSKRACRRPSATA